MAPGTKKARLRRRPRLSATLTIGQRLNNGESGLDSASKQIDG